MKLQNLLVLNMNVAIMLTRLTWFLTVIRSVNETIPVVLLTNTINNDLSVCITEFVVNKT